MGAFCANYVHVCPLICITLLVIVRVLPCWVAFAVALKLNVLQKLVPKCLLIKQTLLLLYQGLVVVNDSKITISLVLASLLLQMTLNDYCFTIICFDGWVIDAHVPHMPLPVKSFFSELFLSVQLFFMHK